MKAIIYKTKEAQPRGEYKSALIDEQKKSADVLLTSIDGDWYSLTLKVSMNIKPGKNVMIYSDCSIAVKESIYKKLAAAYNIMTDF